MKEQKWSHSTVLMGMSFLADVYAARGVVAVAFLIKEPNDEQLIVQDAIAIAAYYQKFNKLVETEEEYKEARALLSNVQENFRTMLVQGIEQQDQDERRAAEFRKQQELSKLMQTMRDNAKPHELGTVAEISIKFGISKSEVRRMKAENRLHELVEKES